MHDDAERSSPEVRIRLAAAAFEPEARRLARRLGIPPTAVAGPEAPAGDTAGVVWLEVGPQGPGLRLGSGPLVRADTSALAAPRPGGRDPLLRAVGPVPEPRCVADATGGLGSDGFHLAACGLRVVMIEREPLAVVLLEAALERARAGRAGPEAARAASRVRLLHGDARTLLGELRPHPAVVVCDPMYPERRSRGTPGKGMALLRALLPEPSEEAGLLAAARAAATRRVVVKRPRRAPPLDGVRPSGSLMGTTTRFDLYAPSGSAS